MPKQPPNLTDFVINNVIYPAIKYPALLYGAIDNIFKKRKEEKKIDAVNDPIGKFWYDFCKANGLDHEISLENTIQQTDRYYEKLQKKYDGDIPEISDLMLEEVKNNKYPNTTLSFSKTYAPIPNKFEMNNPRVQRDRISFTDALVQSNLKDEDIKTIRRYFQKHGMGNTFEIELLFSKIKYQVKGRSESFGPKEASETIASQNINTEDPYFQRRLSELPKEQQDQILEVTKKQPLETNVAMSINSAHRDSLQRQQNPEAHSR